MAENDQDVLRDELYAIPLEKLREKALALLNVEISGAGVVSILPVTGKSDTPEARFIIDTWADREIEEAIRENRDEYYKMLRGEPHNFDEYARY